MLMVAACSSGSTDVDEVDDAGVSGSAVTPVVETTPPSEPDLEPESPTDDDTPATTDTVVGAPDSLAEPVAESVEDTGIVTRAPDATEMVLPEGFGSVTATVTSADGEVCDVCLWLADDDTLRERGLMGVTDLGGAVGMAFRWEQPRDGNFFMFQTPTPLSIAWFDADGAHVGQADMQPCLVDDSSTCERYGAEAPYTVAIEMFGGQLDAVGIGPGSTVELLDLPCA